MSDKPLPPSTSQMKVLANLIQGKPPFVHMQGHKQNAAHAMATSKAMQKRGWITEELSITDEGRKTYADRIKNLTIYKERIE